MVLRRQVQSPFLASLSRLDSLVLPGGSDSTTFYFVVGEGEAKRGRGVKGGAGGMEPGERERG